MHLIALCYHYVFRQNLGKHTTSIFGRILLSTIVQFPMKQASQFLNKAKDLLHHLAPISLPMLSPNTSPGCHRDWPCRPAYHSLGTNAQASFHFPVCTVSSARNLFLYCIFDESLLFFQDSAQFKFP